MLFYLSLAVLPKQIGKIAVDHDSAQFPMVLRLFIHDQVTINKINVWLSKSSHSIEKQKNHLVHNWIKIINSSSVDSTARKEKRSQIIASLEIAVKVSKLFNLFSN